MSVRSYLVGDEKTTIEQLIAQAGKVIKRPEPEPEKSEE